MTIYAYPATAGIKNIEWTLDQPAQVNRSEWTKRRQVVDQPGPAMWSATFDLVAKIGEANMLDIQAWLVELEGQRHTFRLRAVENAQVNGVHNVVVDGAGQGPRSLKLRGGVVGETLKRGHKLTVNDQMVMLMAPVTFDDTGRATANFKPGLRLSPVDGTFVELVFPTVLVALTGSSVGWRVDPGQAYQSKQLTVEEAF